MNTEPLTRTREDWRTEQIHALDLPNRDILSKEIYMHSVTDAFFVILTDYP